MSTVGFKFSFFLLHPRWECEVSNHRVCMPAGLSVCLSVRWHFSKTTCPNSIKFSEHVTRGRGSVLLLRQYNILYLSGFGHNVMISHNGANGPESKTTHMFDRWRYRRRSMPLLTASCLQTASTAEHVALW